ncbi:hypothetical protein [Aliivibrio fischeri]|uniref:hypothetical protein n=1 Tax=Aliivibrio fischeri TaxID=668 RepID=UPI0020B1FA96|nr:hypothetical protein [Aliivibrio fischeri]
MGAYPNGCYQILVNNNPMLLSEFINTNKSAVLSLDTAEMFGELVSCTLFEEKTVSSLRIQPIINGNKESYEISVSDFEFDCFRKADDEVVKVKVNSAEIIFATEGDVIASHSSGESLILKRGESVFIPAYAKEYRLSSKDRIARVFN